MSSCKSDETHRTIWSEVHQIACELDLDYYLDPETGYQVKTKLNHLKRGYCCQSGCRHCPYSEKPDV